MQSSAISVSKNRWISSKNKSRSKSSDIFFFNPLRSRIPSPLPATIPIRSRYDLPRFRFRALTAAIARELLGIDRSRRPPAAEIGGARDRSLIENAGRINGAVTALLLTVSLCSTSSSARGSSPEESFITHTVSSHDVVIFSKSYCPYCRRAKAVFEQLKKAPYVIELDQRDDGDDIQDALGEIFGRRTVPQVFVTGKHIGGSDDTAEAYESGRLAKLLDGSSRDL